MKIRSMILGLLIFFAGVHQIQAQEKMELNLGTMVPKDTNWFKILQTIAADWAKESNGAVTIRLPKGISGTETNIATGIRGPAGSEFQMAAISTIGLRELAPEVLVLDMPNLVQTEEERKHLLKTLGPKLEKILWAKGFVVLGWSEIGFTYFFTNTPRNTVDELKKAKLAFWGGDRASAEVWQKTGFTNLHDGSMARLDADVNAGDVDTFIYTNSLASAMVHVPSDKIHYRLEMPFSSFTGAIIVKKIVWEKIPVDLQVKLKALCAKHSDEIARLVKEDEAKYLNIMKSRKNPSLEIVSFSPEEKKKWDNLVTSTYQSLKDVANQTDFKGKAIPADLIDDAVKIVADYRKSHPQK